MQQLELAGSALKAVVEIAIEVTGTNQDVIHHAPETFNVTFGAEKDDHLYWVKPQEDAVDTRPLGAQPAAQTSGEPAAEVQG